MPTAKYSCLENPWMEELGGKLHYPWGVEVGHSEQLHFHFHLKEFENAS